MNKKVIELALQSGFAHDPMKNQVWVDGGVEVMISPGLEKFAALLTREYINVVRDVPNGYKDYRNQIEDDMRNEIIAAIAAKFGLYAQ